MVRALRGADEVLVGDVDLGRYRCRDEDFAVVLQTEGRAGGGGEEGVRGVVWPGGCVEADWGGGWGLVVAAYED